MTPGRRVIRTDAAPGAVGPYSQAIVQGGLVWASGQIPLDPATGVLLDGPIEEQARRVLRNLQAVLESAGTDLRHVLKVTVYLTDLGDFEAMNGVFATFFREAPPARATVQVSGLPKGARIEVDAVAALP